MRALCPPLSRRAFLGGLALAAASPARAAPAIRLAAQKTGTFAWELDVIAARGLDKAADIAIETAEFASPKPRSLRFWAGQADIIISDWLCVSRARSLGDAPQFYPYSSAIGAVMTPAASRDRELGRSQGQDARGRRRSARQELAHRRGRRLGDGLDLKTEASIVYGAPSLLAAKARQGEFDATLKFWNFCADLEAEGFHRAGRRRGIGDEARRDRPARQSGYVFNEDWARRNKDALARFLEMTRKAKDILAETPEEWERLKPRLNLRDAAALAVLRQRYCEGMPRRTVKPRRPTHARFMPCSRGSAAPSSSARPRSSTPARSTRSARADSRKAHASRHPFFAPQHRATFRAMREARRRMIWRIASLAGFLLVWQLSSHLAGPRLLPSPEAVLMVLVEEARSGALALNLRATLASVAAAFMVALLAGAAIGYAMGRSSISTGSPIPGSSCS